MVVDRLVPVVRFRRVHQGKLEPVEKGRELVHLINVISSPVLCRLSASTGSSLIPKRNGSVKKVAEQAGARAAVSDHWGSGGDGAWNRQMPLWRHEEK